MNTLLVALKPWYPPTPQQLTQCGATSSVMHKWQLSPQGTATKIPCLTLSYECAFSLSAFHHFTVALGLTPTTGILY